MPRRRFTFTAKQIGATMLIVLADILVFGPWLAPTIGVFALAWSAIVLATVARARRGGALVAGIAAIVLGGVLLDDPSVLGWVLFWIALSLAVLLTRHSFDDASRWGQRLVMHGLLGFVTPLRDGQALMRVRRGGGVDVLAIARTVALPLTGSVLFLALFAGANPLIGDLFARIALPDGASSALHVALWIAVVLCVWPSLRPFPAVFGFGARSGATRALPPLPVGTLILSLASFNSVFALQNALDIVFLWSGAALPGGVTLADYAHRGAYTLIATALLAGLFVLVALQPSSAGAESRSVRRLLVLWVAQNVLLVASSALRLIDYIAAYSLTVLRIAALAWMALVAVGLVLICWRLLARRSAAWLINTNAAAAALVLVAASLVDLGAVAASWNVRHASTAKDLDLCYLNGLGESALLPLVELERRVGGDLRTRVAFVRIEALRDAVRRQDHPLTASLRNARRIDAALAALGPDPRRIPAGPRTCDGILVPPEPAPPAPTVLPTLPDPARDAKEATLTTEGER